jgi:hypothetical protein
VICGAKIAARGLRGDPGGVGAEDGDRDLAFRNRLRASDALGCGGVQCLAVVFTDDEYLVH